MNLLKIKGFDKDFVIEPGKIYSIKIENSNFYYNLIRKYYEQDEEYYIYSENGKISDFVKKSIIISDCFNLDPNNKKIINSLYKKISTDDSSFKYKTALEKINLDIINVLNDLSLNQNTEMNYNLELDFQKLLSLYNYSFCFDDGIFLDNFTTYIKANLEIIDIKFILGINILSLLSMDELEKLKTELNFLGIALIDMKINRKFSLDLVDSIIIDNDLCEI